MLNNPSVTLLDLRIHRFEELQKIGVIIVDLQVGGFVFDLHALVDSSLPDGLDAAGCVRVGTLQAA